jgi:outer membrane protein assembly factor BamB
MSSVTPLLWKDQLFVVDGINSTLYSVDAITGDIRWSVSVQTNGVLGPPCVGAGPGQGMYSSVLLPVLYFTDGQNVYAVAIPSDTDHAAVIIYSCQPGQTLPNATAPIFDRNSNQVLFAGDGAVTAIQSTAGSPWAQSWQVPLGGSLTSPVSYGNRIYVANSLTTATVNAIDVVTGLFISVSLNTTVANAPACDGVSLYVPGDTGALYALEPSSLNEQWNQTPGGPITTPPIVVDGFVYFGSSDNNLYSLDCNGGASGVSLALDGPLEYVAHVASGTVYCGTQSKMVSQNLAWTERQFLSRSEFMQQMEPGAPNQPIPTATYRTEIVVFNVDKSVRVNESLKIWASEPVTIDTGTGSFAISPDTPLHFQTDASGRVSLSMRGNPLIKAGSARGLTCPAIKLWADFMEPQERILIFPDQTLHDRLSAIGGSQLLAANSYNDLNLLQPGDPLLSPPYDTGDAADAIASTVNNAIGLKNTLAAVPSPTRYLAFPETTAGVLYLPQDSAAFRAAAAGNWSLKFPSGGATPVFQTLTSNDAAQSSRRLREALPEDTWGDLVDFINDVINGAELVVDLVWQTVEGAVTATIQGIKTAWQFTVQTIEDAASVLLGVFKTIGAAIENVLEALSYIFSWSAIVELHSTLVQSVQTGFSNAIAFVGTIDTDVKNLLNSWTGQVNAFFQKLETQVGSSPTFSTARGSNTDPAYPFTAGGAPPSNSVPGQWFAGKLRDSVQSSTNSAAAIHAWHAALASPADDDPLLVAFETFFNAIVSGVAQVASGLPGEISGIFDQLGGMFKDSSTFLSTAVNTFLTTLNDIVDDCLAVAQVLVDAFLALLQAVLQIILDMLTAEISIPLLSDLYSMLTGGSQLSLLDAACLAIAIPVHIITATLGDLPAAAAISPEQLVSYVAYTVSAFCYGIFDALADGMEAVTVVVRGVCIAFTTALQAFGSPFVSGVTDTLPVAVWLYQWIPAVANAKRIRDQLGSETPIGAAFDGTYGVCHLLILGLSAIADPGYFWGNGLSFAQNMLGAIPECAKFLGMSEDPKATAALMIIDFVGDLGSAALSCADWFPSVDGAPTALTAA